jgi:hypothetical protein
MPILQFQSCNRYSLLFVHHAHSELILVPKPDCLSILVVSQLLPVTSFKALSSDNTLIEESAPNEIQSFFQNNASEFSSPSPLFKIYGMHSSPTKKILTFFYECSLPSFWSDSSLVPNDRPQYRTALDYKTTLRSMILGNIEQAIEEYVQHISDTVQGTSPDGGRLDSWGRRDGWACEICLGGESVV